LSEKLGKQPDLLYLVLWVARVGRTQTDCGFTRRGGCAIAIVALVTINKDQDHSIPLASILAVVYTPKDCVLKLLIDSPLYSSIRSFISTHDPT
jgi:hypothetical protein